MIRVGFLIALILVVHSNPSRADKIADYYSAMVDKGESEFPQLGWKKTRRNGLESFLVAGNILTFVGKRTEVRFPVDALIISTNVQLRVNAKSPRIQRKFRDLLPELQHRKIHDAFRAKGELDAVTEALLIDLGEFSPQYVCFLATDKSEGGTYDDPEWQKLLEVENVEVGVKECLDRFRELGASTIVTPLIGSSINPLVEGEEYISDEYLREEHIERRVRSLDGIISGADSSESTPREFGIIVWDEDVWRIIHPDLRKDRRYREDNDVLGFWGIRLEMQEVFGSDSRR